jgi:hypothetical protein
MANLPEFSHIHCSSRYDRSAADLESDLDDWMAKASVITLTEVGNDNRAATMREKGWAYYNAKSGQGKDDVGICWKSEDWKRVSGAVRRISDGTFERLVGHQANPLFSATVVLRNTHSGHKLLISVTHMPAHVQGASDFANIRDEPAAVWEKRKLAYLSGLKNWSLHVKDQERKGHVDATLIVGDWNVNLKLDWVRQLLASHWGDNYIQAWKRFPTAGGSLTGGAVVPLGAPGKGVGDRIIDGSLYRGLKVTDEPNLMRRVKSSDHRPYQEAFRFMSLAEKPLVEDGQADGDTIKKYPEWWGFGDYLDDEIYQTVKVTGEAGGEVL